LAFTKPAHKRATYEGPLPFAVVGMLGLTRSPGQANAACSDYNFSLYTPSFRIFSGLVAIRPETAICEKHPLQARDRMADRCSLFPLGRQICRPPALGVGNRDRTAGGRDQRPLEPVEQPLFYCAAGEELGQLCQGDRYLLHPGLLLHRTRFLPTLSQPMPSDPLAELVDAPLPRPMAA